MRRSTERHATRGAAFLFGLGLVVAPALSLAGALATSAYEWIRGRGRQRAAPRGLAWTAVGLALVIAPIAFAHGPSPMAWSTIILASLCVVSVALASAVPRSLLHTRATAIGAALGAGTLALVAGASFAMGSDRVSAWFAHPNSWGAAVAASSVAAACLFPMRRFGWISAAIWVGAIVAVFLSGSRTATAGLGAGLVLAAAVDAVRAQAWRRWLAVLGTCAVAGVIVLVATGIGARYVPSFGPSTHNQVIASEELTSEYWARRDVLVRDHGREDGVAVHELVATSRDGLARLHQRVSIGPSNVVTFAVDMAGRPVAEGDAGLIVFEDDGWSITADTDGMLRHSRGTLTVVDSGVEVLDGEWRRLRLSLRNDASEATVMWLGLAPSLSGAPEASVLVRKPMLVGGTEALPYEGTTGDDRRRELAARSASQRLGYVGAALDVTAARPWFGHGAYDHFARLADEVAPGRLTGSNRPMHPHSLPMEILTRWGAVGAAGWTLIFLGVARAARRDAWLSLSPLVLVLVISNLGDSTLLIGTPLYALLVAVLVVRRSRRDQAGALRETHASR